jgi:hypothetical protein
VASTRRARAIRSTRDLSHERSIVDHAADHDQLPLLHVGADPYAQLSQSLEALRFVIAA